MTSMTPMLSLEICPMFGEPNTTVPLLSDDDYKVKVDTTYLQGEQRINQERSRSVVI